MRFKFLTESYKKKPLKEARNDSPFKAYITNLGKYNEGDLVGEWVDFPIDEDEFQGILNKIQIGPEYEEWFVTDYDCPIDAYSILGEYPSFDELNEFGTLIANDTNDAFKAILETQSNFDYAKDIYERGNYQFYPGIYSLEDLAYEYIDEIGGVEALGDTAENYFDYDKLGRDLRLEYYQEDEDMPETAGEYWCGDENATDTDIGTAYVDNVGLDGVQNSDYYFDYNQFGRDLGFDGYTVTDYGVIYTE